MGVVDLRQRGKSANCETRFVKRLFFILFSLAALSLNAADIAVGPSATGSGNGSDWNNQAAFSSVTFTRGNTYFLADGTYGSRTFNTAASGTTLITVKKAIESDHGPATGWVSTMGDGEAFFTGADHVWDVTSAYWVFDGQTGTGENARGIRIVGTGSDTSEIGNSVVGLNAQHVTFKSITMAQSAMFKRGYPLVSAAGGSWASSCSFLHLTNCFFLYGNGWVKISNGTTTDLLIERCVFKDTGSIESAAHCAGLTFQFNSGGSDVRWVIRYNVFHNMQGTENTTWIEPSSSSPWGGLDIYGNIFYMDAGVGKVSQGVMTDAGTTQYSNTRFHNNTLYNLKGNFSNSGAAVNAFRGNNVVVTNNIWLLCDGGGPAENAVGGNNTINTGTVPFEDAANGNFRLTNTLAGVTLAAAYNVDFDGETRGADGTWDRGAFEFDETGGDPDVTDPEQTGASINAAGTTLTITFDEATTGNTGFSLDATNSLTLSNPSGSGSGQRIFTISPAVLQNATVTLDYTAGNVVDTSANALQNFTGRTVTNNSTFNPDTDPPTGVSITNLQVLAATRLLVEATAEDENEMTFSVATNGTLHASGSSSPSWIIANLAPGSTNSVEVWATDNQGNAATGTISGALQWTNIVFTTPGTNTYTTAAGQTNVNLGEVIGGGGGAGSTTFSSRSGAGGGAFSSSGNIAVTPETAYTVFVGAGGSPNNPGQPSWFISPATLLAVGGTNSANDGPTVGAAGLASSSIGQTKYNGGAGGTRDPVGNGAGGGGGGGASWTGAGTSGGASGNETGGAGGSLGGGRGGDYTQNGTSATANTGGGGGGAGESASTSGSGGSGVVIVHWLAGAPEEPPEEDTEDPVVTLVFPNRPLAWLIAPTALYSFEVDATDNIGVTGMTGFTQLGNSTGNSQGGPRWAIDLPITDGSNYCSLTISDAAGNSTTTNLVVYSVRGTLTISGGATVTNRVDVIGGVE